MLTRLNLYQTLLHVPNHLAPEPAPVTVLRLRKTPEVFSQLWMYLMVMTVLSVTFVALSGHFGAQEIMKQVLLPLVTCQFLGGRQRDEARGKEGKVLSSERVESL